MSGPLQPISRPRRWALWLAALGVIGCGAQDAPVSGSGAQRIVSLSPALTQMLIDLGRGEQIVAVGRYDPAAPPDRPVVGSVFQIDYEKLLAVRPTHVLLQPERNTGVPPKLRALSDRHGWRLATYHIDTLSDAARVLHDPRNPARSLGGVLGAADDAQRLAERMRQRLERVRGWTADLMPVRTLLVFRIEPLGVVGRGTFLDEMLGLAGGVNAVNGAFYQTADREQVLAMRPEAVILLSSGDEFDRRRIAQWKREMSRLPIPAAAPGSDDPGRILVLSDPMAKLPSSSAPRVAAKLAALLHPQLAGRAERLIGDEPPEVPPTKAFEGGSPTKAFGSRPPATTSGGRTPEAS